MMVAYLLHITELSKSVKPGSAEEAVGYMVKFRLICPECDAVIITSSPEALAWELCPGCKSHIWDMCDALMADVVPQNPHKAANSIIHPDN
jgi:hypothetical protein